MKIVEIVDGKVHREYPELHSLEEAYQTYAKTLTFVECPDNVFPGFGFDSSKQGADRFIRPILEDGWEYDEGGHPWNPEAHRFNERMTFHAETTNDTMQALRKIREGDTSIDWSKWLDMLDAYNVAIEETKNQKDYPLKVVYPDYPKKPTK